MKTLTILIPETDEEKRNHDALHGFVTMDGQLTEDGELLAVLGIDLINRASFRNADAHGWYEWLGTSDKPKAELAQRNFGEIIALIHSEVTEAFEAYRNNEPILWYEYDQNKYPAESNKIEHRIYDCINDLVILGKPQGIASEFADVIIRIADYAGAYGIPVALALIHKHAYNVNRPYRHGGKRA